MDTPIINLHKGLNAKIVKFAGWNMPLFYSGIIDEYWKCRKESVIFDTCHMGEIIFRGDFTNSGIDYAVTPNIESLETGQAKYGFILNESGGILDDMVIFRSGEKELLIVVNAETVNNDFEVIKERISEGEIFNVTEKTAKLDVQGPLSRSVLEKFFKSVNELNYFRCINEKYKGSDVLVSRTGYTGELGYELYINRELVEELWKELLENENLYPAGLGARDILRLDMGYSLYGADIDETISPVEAGLNFFIDYEKDFFGKNGLLEREQSKFKIALKTDSKRSPRNGYILKRNNEKIGYVTSGTYSPSLDCGIGLGYLNVKTEELNNLKAVSADERISIDVTKCRIPFYKDGTLKN